MARILEAGHYYTAKGPTRWSQVGWEILEEIRDANDSTMLFVDDVHSIKNLHPSEQLVGVVPFRPEADYVVTESSMRASALCLLDELKGLSKKKRARLQKSGPSAGMWFCSGFPVTTTDGTPLCVLLDAGLCLYKHRLGFSETVVVLPHYYESQQLQMRRLVAKVLPEFTVTTILFDEESRSWEL